MQTATQDRPKQEIAPTGAASLPATMTDANTLMAIITRAASDPTADIDKLERLMGMYERAVTRDAERAFNDAMALAQAEMRPIAQDSDNPQTRSRYASHAGLDRAVRPIYTRYGFALSYNTGEGAPADHVRVVCDASRGGYTRRYHIDMPCDGKGAKGGDVMSKTHAAGSAVTYGRRYLLVMIFNLSVGKVDDDDGNAAGAGDKITAAEVQVIRDKLKAAGANEGRFCKHGKVNRLEDITSVNYDRACAAIEAFARSAKTRSQGDVQ